ncbi:MAG TPA: VWA domain-containing protein, partial [Gammaproteobacteria bacterium]
MLEFIWPWMFYLLPLPLLARLLLPPAETRQAALKTPFLEDFRQETTTAARAIHGRQTLVLAGLCWLLLVTATARPQWVGEPVELPVSGRDLMMAVDLSGSMNEQDFFINDRPVDRLTAAKRVAGEFIDRRAGDRLGLILFGDRAYMQTPLTFD